MCTANKPFLRAFFLLVIAFTVSGCMTMKAYPGPELPPEKIAIIKPKLWQGLFRPQISIAAVDGIRRRIFYNYFAVKPGKHLIEVNSARCFGGYQSLICIPYSFGLESFEAEPGHTYIVHGISKRGKRFLWIEDAETKQIVAGQKPE